MNKTLHVVVCNYISLHTLFSHSLTFFLQETLIIDTSVSKPLNCRNGKKPRRPRKLPEIPPNIIRRGKRLKVWDG